MRKIAVLVDGGFYRKRALKLFGKKSPQERATELHKYALKHVYDVEDEQGENELYRIFYYDCIPTDAVIFHPLTRQQVEMNKIPSYQWSLDFFNELKRKRKVAFRKGELLESKAGFVLYPEVMRKLCNRTLSIDDLTEKDFYLDIKQKGVDMRIGLDISSMAYKKQVDRIVLIAGDSDFVPAAKHARREGIDFILDPMWQKIKPSLQEHIDGLQSMCPKPNEQSF